MVYQSGVFNAGEISHSWFVFVGSDSESNDVVYHAATQVRGS